MGSGFLALTVDSVAEEMACGLYREPETVGWVAAMASLSDLAAVGARPLGVLLAAEWGRELPEGKRRRFFRAFESALRESNTYLLGGDQGGSPSSVISVTAIGQCERKPVSRLGIRAGDTLAVTGQVGRGPALGFRYLLGLPGAEFPEKIFRPRARLDLSGSLGKVARACMDTSDGFATTLHQLGELNQVSFELTVSPALFEAKARAFCQKRGLPFSSLLYGEIGDYQLMMAIPPGKLAEARSKIPGLHLLGKAVSKSRKNTVDFGEGRVSVEWDFVCRRKRETIPEIRDVFDRMVRYVKGRKFP
jgi:thiamine-monophosphate kinase